MKNKSVIRRLSITSGGVWLAAMIALNSHAGQDIKLVPYEGEVAGDLMVNMTTGTLKDEYSSAPIWASHLGEGVQLYQQGEVFAWPDELGNLHALGFAYSIAANGDVLPIQFDLIAPGAFLVPEGTSFAYSGHYYVLPGGSGRFDFPASDELGAGSIDGVATLAIDSANGTATLSFAHTFEGTLAQVKAAKAKGQ